MIYQYQPDVYMILVNVLQTKKQYKGIHGLLGKQKKIFLGQIYFKNGEIDLCL